MKAYFYPKSLYTSILAFSDLFNSMTVRVFDNDGRIVGIKPVVMTLAPKEKIVSILTKTDINDVDPQVDNYLPRISINTTGINWNPDRMRGKHENRLLNIEYYDATELDENGNKKRREMQIDQQPTPYDLTFEVAIWTKYDIDMKQILENILPFFAPEIHISIKERNFGIERKCKVTLNGINFNNTVELGEEDRRVLQTLLTFTMETVLYKPMEIKKEILCSMISISEVPCKRIPFPGDKIIAYDPNPNDDTSLFDKDIKLAIQELDAGEKYDLMVKYWQYANNNMNPPYFSSCVKTNCQEPIPPRPGWDLDNDGQIDPEQPSPCTPLPRKPIVFIDDSTQNITIYYQEINEYKENPTDPVKIIIISYVKELSPTGDLISGPTIIPNEDYPDAPNNLNHLNS